MSESFVLHEELLKLQEKDYFIHNEVQITDINESDLEGLLNDIVEKIAVSSSVVTEPEIFDVLRSNFNRLKPSVMSRILDTIISGLQSEIENTSRDIDANDEETFPSRRESLEMYAFLLGWIINLAETKTASKNTAVTAGSSTGEEPVVNAGDSGSGRGKGKKSLKASSDSEGWNWSAQKIITLELISSVLDLRINRIWTSTHERDTFVSVFTKSAYQMLENTANTKIAKLKFCVYKILSKCVKDYNHAFGAQTTIIQNLQYYEHLSEPMAEFLEVLANQFDHTQLAEEILIEISNKEFKGQDTTIPKSYSKFLFKFSELVPKLVLKHIGLLIKHLDSESHTMRCGFIEVIGCLISHIANQEEQTEVSKNQVNGFFDVLEERFLDNNSYCRSKILQVCLKLCDLKVKFPKRRQRLTDLVIRSLEDKTPTVRKNAIKLLTKLITTHPYGMMHGGELSVNEWEERLRKADEELKAVQPPTELQGVEEENQPVIDDEENKENIETNTSLLSIDRDNHQSSNGNEDELRVTNDAFTKLQLTKRFYADAVRFIHQIHTAIPTLCVLLASTNKAEVLEAIEFFVAAHTYKIEKANEGIKKMVHLIWTKDNSDEGKGVRKRLIDSYRTLYLSPDDSLTENENVDVITKNLISLTFNATLAELTSLDLLLSTMMAEADGCISDNIIEKLWSVYATTRNISKVQRRGAIIVLGMLAKAKTEIISEKTDFLLKIGLGPLGKADLALARYTCIALQCLAGTYFSNVGSLNNDSIRFPMTHSIFQRLQEIIEFPTKSHEWFAVAEQAINTIYLLGEHPDILCGDIIKKRTALVFDIKPPSTEESSINQEDESILGSQETFTTYPIHLSQLLFIVGHVAIKQIVHLEVIEAEWKRRKADGDSKDKAKAVAKTVGEDELDQIAGTTEDEFGEAISHIREKELLFGSNSLLPVFGSMATHICSNNKSYKDPTLQIAATLALSKFMCVSSEFCENNLQLLLTILERATEPIIRSNIIIALGDMTVCFNNVIDENINYLYKRLADPDIMVKKNTLMVLTHLILNGMIKVKGQLGEMAKCLEDKDERISDLARLFFTELASKDNAVYNNLPDIISNLSSGENAVNEDSFKEIMKFLFEFIEKDKQTENVVEKLCQRFKNLDDKRQWRDIAFCLSLLSYKSEKSFKKLVEGIPNYQDKLHEEAVYKHFMEIISKANSQKPQKPELKQIVDEFENRITELKSRVEEQEETMKKAKAVAKMTAKTVTTKPVASSSSVHLESIYENNERAAATSSSDISHQSVAVASSCSSPSSSVPLKSRYKESELRRSTRISSTNVKKSSSVHIATTSTSANKISSNTATKLTSLEKNTRRKSASTTPSPPITTSSTRSSISSISSAEDIISSRSARNISSFESNRSSISSISSEDISSRSVRNRRISSSSESSRSSISAENIISSRSVRNRRISSSSESNPL
ncbi:5283_t:CDS:10 [Ambispora gerdemannii]|uniref:Condensin complex subunit 1 n=1 Tax=Ambispora gerdemannii TaxID=144530 RepID=A0A9N9BTS0_9GLOM|nr:5283_t:CDS:10 [Ambispora gerdemannii]